MAPDPARADTVNAAAVHRGTCAGGTDSVDAGAVDLGTFDVGPVDVFAAAVADPLMDDRGVEDVLGATVRAGAGAGDADAVVVAAMAPAVATVLGPAAAEAVGAVRSAVVLLWPQAPTNTTTATRPRAANAPLRWGLDGLPADRPVAREPPIIS